MRARKQEVWKQEMRGGRKQKVERQKNVRNRADALFLFLPTCEVMYNIPAFLLINREAILIINADSCESSNADYHSP